MSYFYQIYISPRTGILPSQIEKEMNLAIDWYRYTNQNWIVYTTSDAKKWHSRLEKFVNPGGNLFICKLDTSDHWGFMNKNLWSWLTKQR